MRFHYTALLGGSGSNSLELRSDTLSWSEHRALTQTAAAAAATAYETGMMRRAIENLHYDIGKVSDAIDQLEASLCLQLEVQASLLRTEVELLANIAESLRTPRATRAAERITDAGALLADKRYERALAAAKEAIEDNPNNRGGFIAAGWALLGLEKVDEARAYFREAAVCGKGDGAHSALRQSARLTFVLDGPHEALAELDGGSVRDVSGLESAAVDFDRAIYQAAAGRPEEAVARLRVATCHERAFALMALTDAVVTREPYVLDATSGILRDLDVLQVRVNDAYEPIRERIRSLLETLYEEREQDQSSHVIDLLSGALSELRKYQVADTARWGFTSLDAALEDAADNHATRAIDRSERYISEQQDALDHLRTYATRGRTRVVVGSPWKTDGAWNVLSFTDPLLAKPQALVYWEPTAESSIQRGLRNATWKETPANMRLALRKELEKPTRWPYFR